MQFSTQQMQILNINLGTSTYYVNFFYLLVIKKPSCENGQAKNVCVLLIGNYF